MGATREPAPESRAELMLLHAQANRRRDAAPLGSDEYRRAAEEIARIEISIAALEEPDFRRLQEPASDQRSR